MRMKKANISDFAGFQEGETSKQIVCLDERSVSVESGIELSIGNEISFWYLVFGQVILTTL